MTSIQLRRFAIILLWIYAAEFVLGMTLNLFVTLPDTHAGTSGSGYYSQSVASLLWALEGGGGVVLFLHALLGVLILIASLVLFIRSFGSVDRSWRWPSGVTLLFTFAALTNGLSFLDFGLDRSSAIMAGCWLVAIGALAFGLIRRRRTVANGSSAAG
jgi:hypothetical protein